MSAVRENVEMSRQTVDGCSSALRLLRPFALGARVGTSWGTAGTLGSCGAESAVGRAQGT